jgi:hypothetical protein
LNAEGERCRERRLEFDVGDVVAGAVAEVDLAPDHGLHAADDVDVRRVVVGDEASDGDGGVFEDALRGRGVVVGEAELAEGDAREPADVDHIGEVVGDGEAAGDGAGQLVEGADLEVPVVGELPVDGGDGEDDEVFLEAGLDDEVGTDAEVLVELVAGAEEAAADEAVFELGIDLAGETDVGRGDEAELAVDDVDE